MIHNITKSVKSMLIVFQGYSQTWNESFQRL